MVQYYRPDENPQEDGTHFYDVDEFGLIFLTGLPSYHDEGGRRVVNGKRMHVLSNIDGCMALNPFYPGKTVARILEMPTDWKDPLYWISGEIFQDYVDPFFRETGFVYVGVAEWDIVRGIYIPCLTPKQFFDCVRQKFGARKIRGFDGWVQYEEETW